MPTPGKTHKWIHSTQFAIKILNLYFRAPAEFDAEPEKPLLNPFNQFREGGPQEPAQKTSVEEDEDERDDDFKEGIDFENMVFADHQKVNGYKFLFVIFSVGKSEILIYFRHRNVPI